jgi:hypothetical protein
LTGSAALRLVAALLLAAAPIAAQSPLTLDVSDGAPHLEVGSVLNDQALEDAVESGLPLRLQFRLEVWHDRVFDELVEQASWTVVVAFEPLERLYLAGMPEDTALTTYRTWDELRDRVEQTYTPRVGTLTTGRYYYIAQLELETLSLSDLDELEHWLRGELQPAVQGQRSVGGAVGNGLKRLLIRVLGLPARHYEARSDVFEVP